MSVAAVVSVALMTAALVPVLSNNQGKPDGAGSPSGYDWAVAHTVVYKVSGRTPRADITWSADGRADLGEAEDATLPGSSEAEFPAGPGTGRATAVRDLLGIPLPDRAVPRVLGIDDFALRRCHDYATVVIDADTGARIDVVPGRGADVVAGWLRTHPGVEVVCRNGSAAYAHAVRDALPHAVQVADRWHLWHGLCDAAGREVAAHSACWASATRVRQGKLAETTLDRWLQIHALREAGVGLLDCSRRLGLALNTVKRSARAATSERIQRHLDEHPHLSSRRAARLLLTRPGNLTERQRERLDALTAACPEMTASAAVVRSFAALLARREDNAARLAAWTTAAREADLPHVHSFARGVDQDIDAVTAAITLEHHNGRAEGVNTKTKLIKRQMYGRAAFDLLRHRISPGDTTESAPEPITR